jgi:hypothetical protein
MRMWTLSSNDEPATSRRAAVKQFFVELKRRKVYRVAVAYIVVAWVLIQVATQVFPFFEIPNWTVRLEVLGLVLGFPIATILAWAYDITPSGIKRTRISRPARWEQPREHSRRQRPLRRRRVAAGDHQSQSCPSVT